MKKHLLQSIRVVHKNAKSQVFYIWSKTLDLSTFCCKCGNNSDKMYKEEESIAILNLTFLVYVINNIND